MKFFLLLNADFSIDRGNEVVFTVACSVEWIEG